MTKKYIVKTGYDSGLMFDDRETAINVLEATTVRTSGYDGKNWTINNKQLSLFIADDSIFTKEPEDE